MNLEIILTFFTILCLPSKSQSCGQFNFNAGLVINGEDTVRGEFPFLIALWMLRDQSFFCGANLLSKRHALTAAHCMLPKGKSEPRDVQDFVALLGKYNLKDLYEKGVVSMEVSNIVIHKDWRPYIDRFDADIALLFFEREVQLSGYIRTVCLPSSWETNNLKEGVVVGWGLSERTNFKKLENTPRKTRIRKPPTNEFCFLHEREFLDLSSNRTFCAEGENSGPCSGDSGGGFFINSNSVWTLQGLVSVTTLNSDFNCDVTKYTVYTNVAYYVEWINEEINGLQPIVKEEDSILQLIVMVCQFSTYQFFKVPPYACDLNVTEITTDNLVFSTVIGEHESGKSINDVTILSITDNNNPLVIRYIPSGIGDLLPSLNTLDIRRMEITKISRKIFKRMTNLQEITLRSNSIEYIDEDTFYELPKLETLDISENKLKTIPLNLLTHFKMLQEFNCNDNNIEELNGEVFRNCPLLTTIKFESNRLKKIKIIISDFSRLRNIYLRFNTCFDSWFVNDESVTTLKEFQNQIDTKC